MRKQSSGRSSLQSSRPLSPSVSSSASFASKSTITEAPPPPTSNVDCYISHIHDPYTNLAIEEWLLRNTDPKRYILFLWRNRSCVVIGRNQNPFQECNLRFMKNNNIPLVRRRSGGGAVYHDMGNSIYTIYMPREAFSRKANAELVSRALLQLDIPASVNDRHDIVVDNHKVSGSAYKIISARAYHHGTMLVDANTSYLKGCLSKKYMNKSGIQSKGVESVPSPVTNLREYSYTVDHQQFCESVLAEFEREYNQGINVQPTIIDQHTIHELPEQVEKTRQELCTWEWMYGQTPEFTHTLDNEFEWGHVHLFLRSRHGLITEVEMTTDAGSAHPITVVSALSVALKGCRYSESAPQEAVDKIDADIPGLLSEENKNVADGILVWMKKELA
ncbi:hypothetical protein [Absidia glauca]|uniref:Putative lipoate-protein ligase A n=1 Tax=Absidia glauca TaxID=4829 RepID=A0A168SK53_ABSGL|nr:hypothetical protein [Absidia glauca]